MSTASGYMPALRQELSLLPGPPADDGSKRWLLFDPVRNIFHSLTEHAVTLLGAWKAEPADQALLRIQNAHPDLELCEDDLKDMTEFLFAQKLTQMPPQGDPETLARQEAQTRKPFHEQIIHKYLFFRIPLFQPQKFLDITAPYIGFMFKRTTWIIIATIGLVGLYFAARQWDQFVTTFMHFFTLEGFIFYAITLMFIKALHELGHGFTAHHFGAHVPVIGLAFLVMFPILYTDTTDAHRLTKRREKVLIDAGGMIVELAIAAISIFLWSFLPDGPARSAAFFAATTSWALSLMVNLNPCMRFDGYYLLSDTFKIQNMQASGFELGRWWMRETLFGFGREKPIKVPASKEKGLLVYCFTTWVYRFFLFIGIAILVHHLFPKAIGIVLFTIEILFFIVMPIWREFKHWGSHSMQILSSRRGRITLIIFAALLGAFFYPWQNHISAPALMRPSLQTEIYPVSAAEIDAIYVENGMSVTQGQRLASLSSDALELEAALARNRIELLTAQLARLAADIDERRQSVTLHDELRAQELALQSVTDSMAELDITAPHDGMISDMPTALHIGRSVSRTDRLLRLVSQANYEMLALPREDHAGRISNAAAFTFISDDFQKSKITGHLDRLAPTSEAVISEAILTSIAGGALAVHEDENGFLITNNSVFKVRGSTQDSSPLARAQRGIVKIKATPQSPAQALWRSIIRVLIRETDF